jgi:4-alpha-glucanotransferase
LRRRTWLTGLHWISTLLRYKSQSLHELSATDLMDYTEVAAVKLKALQRRWSVSVSSTSPATASGDEGFAPSSRARAKHNAR